MDWRIDGPIWKAFMHAWLNSIVSHYVDKQNHDDGSFIDIGSKALSTESFDALKKELDEISRKYSAIAKVERRVLDANKVRPYTCLMIVDHWSDDYWTVPPYAKRRSKPGTEGKM
jgi:hypothetical protein